MSGATAYALTSERAYLELPFQQVLAVSTVAFRWGSALYCAGIRHRIEIEPGGEVVSAFSAIPGKAPVGVLTVSQQ